MGDSGKYMAQSAGWIAFATFIVVAWPTRPWWMNMLCWTSVMLHSISLVVFGFVK